VAQPGDFRVRGQRYADGGGPLGINFEIARFYDCCPSLYSVFTDVAMDGSGDFAVAWDGTRDGVTVRLYDGP
ncbi:MAG: hypothetical protein ACREVL_10950, partial [Solimonas sp.]